MHPDFIKDGTIGGDIYRQGYDKGFSHALQHSNDVLFGQPTDCCEEISPECEQVLKAPTPTDFGHLTAAASVAYWNLRERPDSRRLAQELRTAADKIQTAVYRLMQETTPCA